MKRVTYSLKDMYGTVYARMVVPEGEGITLDPWMLDKVNNHGWRVEAWETKESGVQIHGWADWKSVADSMAEILTAILDDSIALDEEQSEEMLARAQSALDNYRVAQMEVSVAQPDEVAEEEEGESDGGEG